MSSEVSTETENTPSWFFDEGVPGQGPIPEFFNPKYKTLAEQAKAYNELERRLGATSGAPNEYDFTGLGVDPNNPHIKDLANYAQENRINQEAFTHLVKGMEGYTQSMLPPGIDAQKELEKLGPNGEKRLQDLDQWLINNFGQKTRDAIDVLATTAEAIEALDEIRQRAYKGVSQPPHGGAMNAAIVPLTEKDVRAELTQNLARYNSDPTYRNEIAEKFRRVVKD